MLGDLTATFQYLRGAYREVREGLLMWNCSDRTRSNRYKLKEGEFKLDIRKKFFIVRVVRHWNDCWGRLWIPQPWQCSRPGWIRP